MCAAVGCIWRAAAPWASTHRAPRRAPAETCPSAPSSPRSSSASTVRTGPLGGHSDQRTSGSPPATAAYGPSIRRATGGRAPPRGPSGGGRLPAVRRPARRDSLSAARHTFMSCCLQAGISLPTVAGWCGTSIQMISETYGRVIRRYEGASPVPLDEQFTAGKVEAMTLLSATQTTPPARSRVGPQMGLWHENCRQRRGVKWPFSRSFGEIAQLVEHTTENRGVPTSSLGLAIFNGACTWAGFLEREQVV